MEIIDIIEEMTKHFYIDPGSSFKASSLLRKKVLEIIFY